MSPQHPQPLFLPKLFSALKNYSWPLFEGDLIAGVIVGIVALPLAIAFAIASGVSPDRGLTTAIVAGFLISALGGSRVQIGGPTGAFVVIIYRIVEVYGVQGLLVCTLLAGLILIGFGVLKLGSVIRFIPYPLTVGFTTGIAVIIFSSQIGDLLGLQTGPLPADFIHKWLAYLQHLDSFNSSTVAVSLGTFLILILWPRFSRRIPASLVAILALTAVVQWFDLPVETIGSRFGSLSVGWPTFSWPSFGYSDLRNLIQPAFTVAFLGAVESLLSATVADSMIEGRHRPNTELIAQGIANVSSSLFGGIPATGAIARTATNVKNGAKTPIAGIVHALTLLLIVLLVGRYAVMIPLCVLAAILVVVSYHMSEWHAFRALLRAPRMDVVVLVTTFVLTVLVNLTAAVQIGLLLSVVLFMKQMTDVTTIREVTHEMLDPDDEQDLRDDPNAVSRRTLPPGVLVYEAVGAFFFGVAQLLRDTMNFGKNPPPVIVLRLRRILALDATGLRALADLRKKCSSMGTQLLLEGIHAQPLVAMERSGLLEEFGLNNVQPDLDHALARAEQILSKPR